YSEFFLLDFHMLFQKVELDYRVFLALMYNRPYIFRKVYLNFVEFGTIDQVVYDYCIYIHFVSMNQLHMFYLFDYNEHSNLFSSDLLYHRRILNTLHHSNMKF